MNKDKTIADLKKRLLILLIIFIISSIFSIVDMRSIYNSKIAAQKTAKVQAVLEVKDCVEKIEVVEDLNSCSLQVLTCIQKVANEANK